jgi:hypothetical protein
LQVSSPWYPTLHIHLLLNEKSEGASNRA